MDANITARIDGLSNQMGNVSDQIANLNVQMGNVSNQVGNLGDQMGRLINIARVAVRQRRHQRLQLR